MWLAVSRSVLLAITSPLTVRRISVTSSGRSSMSSMMRCISGWFVATAWAMCWSRIVLPVRGGATIRPRWPLPMGVSRSMTRVVSGSGRRFPGGSARAGRSASVRPTRGDGTACGSALRCARWGEPRAGRAAARRFEGAGQRVPSARLNRRGVADKASAGLGMKCLPGSRRKPYPLGCISSTPEATGGVINRNSQLGNHRQCRTDEG